MYQYKNLPERYPSIIMIFKVQSVLLHFDSFSHNNDQETNHACLWDKSDMKSILKFRNEIFDFVLDFQRYFVMIYFKDIL